MTGLVVASLRRRLARTLLTAMGIGVGVAAVVALISLGDGLKQTAAGFIHLGKADLGIFQKGISDPTASVLPTSMVPRLESQPGVAWFDAPIAARGEQAERHVGFRDVSGRMRLD